MKKSRLLKLFRTFSKEEVRQFDRFLHSPYHNRSQQCIAVFDSIKFYYEAGMLDGLTRASLLQKTTQDIKKTHTLDVIISKLTRLAEDFIALENLNKHNYLKKHLLLEGLFERQQLEYSKGIFKTLKERRISTTRKGIQYYFEAYLLSRDEYFNSVYMGDKDTLNHLINHINALDEFYLIDRLRLSYEILNRQMLQPIDYKEDQLEKIIQLADTGDLRENPLIDIFYTTVLTLNEQDNEEHFERLLFLSNKHHSDIPKSNLSDLYKTLGNFCITKIVKGETKYMQTLFLIYQTQVAQGNLFWEKFISAQVMKNIISLGAQLGEFEWTDEFLESHIRYIQPEIRDNVYHFHKGVLAFYQKDFKGAMEHLNQTNKMELSFELGRKTILLRSYYELKEDIAFDALCKSFKEYVRSQKEISGRLKKAYVNFTIVLKKIDNIRRKKDYEKIEKLMDKINNYEYLSNKPWILEKLKELTVIYELRMS